MPTFFLPYPLIPPAAAVFFCKLERAWRRREKPRRGWQCPACAARGQGFASGQQQLDPIQQRCDGAGLGADPQPSWIPVPEVTAMVVDTKVVI